MVASESKRTDICFYEQIISIYMYSSNSHMLVYEVMTTLYTERVTFTVR